MTPATIRSVVATAVIGFALISPRLAGADRTLDVGSGHSVVFDQPASFKMEAAESPEDIDGKSIKLTPRNGANAECNITFIIDSDKRLGDHDAIKKLLILQAGSMLEQSLENKVNAHEFKTPHAFGFAATLTDKNLVGKPEVRGDYKSETFVTLLLPEQIVAVATILVDDPQGPEYAAMIALLRSLGAHTASSVI
ncbi:MAG TPA: hypothetical protein VHD32_04690 [Candidatus Didemnitutus sp.]|nr:hypothetical protein [Candidatus Didemnitutus sp.]